MTRGFWLWAAALATYAFLYVPLAVVVLFSFNDLPVIEKLGLYQEKEYPENGGFQIINN